MGDYQEATFFSWIILVSVILKLESYGILRIIYMCVSVFKFIFDITIFYIYLKIIYS